MEDKAGLIFYLSLVIIGALVTSLFQQTREINVLKAKCLKIGVATMTYDIDTGNSKFVFEVGDNHEKQAVSGFNDNQN